jgi:AraC-like DNA-binding protein
MKSEIFNSKITEPLGKYDSKKFHQLFFPLRGNIRIDVAFKIRKINRGQLFYLGPKIIHKLILEKSALSFATLQIDRAEWKKQTNKNFDFMLFTPSKLLQELITSQLKEWDIKTQHLLQKNLLRILVYEMSNQCSPTDHIWRPMEHCLSRGLDQRVKKAIHLILNQATDSNFNVDILSKDTFISRRQLQRLFVEHLGISPARAIKQVKIERAIDLILRTDMNISDVCYKVGFSSQSQFNSTFLKLVGKTPSSLRKNKT